MNLENEQDKIEFKAQEDTENFLKNTNLTGRNSMVPPPPPIGEYMICQICGKKILPEDISKNKEIRKYQFKWHLHVKCIEFKDDLLDRSTPGLLAERNRKY